MSKAFSVGEIVVLLLPTIVSVVVLVVILVIQVARRPDTAELNRLTQRVRDLEVNHVADFAQIQQLHDKLLYLGRIVSLFADYVMDLHAQLEEKDMEPARPLPDEAREWLRTQQRPASQFYADDNEYISQVTHVIDHFFGEEDMRMLATEMGIDYENLRGETKRGRALAFVQLSAQLGRLPELVEMIKRYRPNIPWPR